MVGAMPVNLIPKFCNGAMDNHNGVDGSDIIIRVGRRVKVKGDFGTVKYIGEVQGYKGVWYGVEWDEPSRGKHSGSVDDIEYFKTSKPGAGSFVRPNKIEPMQSCADAIRKYYSDREDETVAAHRRTAINEWKREMKAPFIEMVGFEKIHQKQKLDRLVEISVSDQCIDRAGPVGSVIPCARSLDISANLFSNWREVITISAQLPYLTDLDVSKNLMAVDMTEEAYAQQVIHFSKLEKLNISLCEYNFSDILTLSHLWPNLRELVAAFNVIKTIPRFHNKLNSLTVLKLDCNPLNDFAEVMNLDSLVNLKVLSLNDCKLKKIRFSNDVGKVKVFRNLEVLFLNRNCIDDWQSVSELDKLMCLRKMYFLKNPLQETDDYDTFCQMVVARIGTLQEFNGSEITPESRRGAEYDYLKRYGGEWKQAQCDSNTKALFDLHHCRFQELIDKHGVPDESLLVKRPKMTTLNSQLLEITLQDEYGKSYTSKFPPTMSIQKLFILAQRLFPKTGLGRPSLYILDELRQGNDIFLDNFMKDLNYFSIKTGDTILVRYS